MPRSLSDFSLGLSVVMLSPGEVPDTREALLSAFKRLDNDISLEAQVGTSADSVITVLMPLSKASRGDLDHQCSVCL